MASHSIETLLQNHFELLFAEQFFDKIKVLGDLHKLHSYSGVHKRSDAYSSILSNPQLFSMVWRTFKMLLPTWQAGSEQIFIRGFQKGRTCPCISRDVKVAGCQSFFLFQKIHLCIIMSHENSATYEHF